MAAAQATRESRIYTLLVTCAGAAVIGRSLYLLYSKPVGWEWLAVALLTVVSSSAALRIPTVPATISASETFVFASTLLFGGPAGTLTIALDTLVISFWFARTWGIRRIMFNVAAPSVSVWVAGQVLFRLASFEPFSHQTALIPIGSLVLPLGLAAVIHFWVNTWLVAFAIAFEKQQSSISVWRTNFAWLVQSYLASASVAGLLVLSITRFELAYVGFILPLVLIVYLAYRSSLGRVEDANKHVVQLNALYLSTIETLAMAIDAKDQVTHGHIRRVQRYAVGLAKALGISDETQLKAIEAAALLHDMGKLAVPEHILNKPGKLTAAEFDRMKLHATIGADILSAIDFPYPVVPIVRHHHENWDGTGYPAGLGKTDIPIGARILSVVDCFDALTSDRPYRPKLSYTEAIRILLERRGNMYDPVVVDTFVRVYQEIGPVEAEVAPVKSVHCGAPEFQSSVSLADATQPRAVEAPAQTDELLSLCDLATSFGGSVSLADTLDAIASHLRRMFPISLVVFFRYDVSVDALAVAYTNGEGGTAFDGLRLSRGERLSGWVAANRRTIINGDPALDLGERTVLLNQTLKSCLSTPLIAEGAFVGTLSLYSTVAEPFREDDRPLIEIVASQIAPTIRRAHEFDVVCTSFKDSATGLPNADRLNQFSALKVPLANPTTVLLVAIDSMRLDDRHALSVTDSVLVAVAATIRKNLRTADLLFRSSANEFAVLLPQTDADTGEAIAQRLRRAVERASSGDTSVFMAASISTATVGTDAQTLTEAITVARERLATIALSPSSPCHLDSARVH